MFTESNSSKSLDLSDWIIEIKSEIANNAENKAKQYNFDFDNYMPMCQAQSKLNWKVDEKVPLGVGVPRKKTYESLSEPVNICIPNLNLNSKLKFNLIN